MNKLPEPDFLPDNDWPRLKHGDQTMKAENKQQYLKWFYGLAALTSFRYLREITYYKKNVQTVVVVPLLVLGSHFIAETKYDKNVLATEENNRREREYITKYKALYKHCKTNNIHIPDNLIH